MCECGLPPFVEGQALEWQLDIREPQGLSESLTVSSGESSDLALRVAGISAIIVTALTVVLLALRLRYGVDVFDESYYAAGSYRFALGMRPLLDDLGAHQFASYLVAPIVWAWLSVRGSLNGVILGLRVVYFIASLLAATVAFLFVRKVVDWRIALISSACSLGLVPALIFAPSYDTIALVFLSIGISLAGIVLIQEGRSWLLVLSGMAMAIAAFAYPTHAATVLVAIVLLGWISRSWKQSVLMALGAMLVAAALFVSMRGTLSGLPDFVTYNRFMSEQQGWHWLSGFPKLAIDAKGIVGATYKAPATYVLAFIVGYRALRRRVPAVLTVALPIAVVLAFHVNVPWERTMNAASLILLSVLVSGLGPVSPSHRLALMYVFGVGTCAAALFAYTSNLGFTNFGVGAAAVSAPAMAVLLNNAREALTERLGAVRAIVAATAVGVVSAVVVLVLCWSAVYGGGYPWQLHKPATGPYEGLLTSTQTAATVALMRSDLARTVDSKDRVLVYGSTPSAYILSPARPVAPFLWMDERDGTSQPRAAFLERWMNMAAHRPTVIVVDAQLWKNRASAPHDYLLSYFDRNYTPVLNRSEYVVLRAR